MGNYFFMFNHKFQINKVTFGRLVLVRGVGLEPLVHRSTALPTELARQLVMGLVPAVFSLTVTDVGDFVPFRFRAITISCHFGDFVPPIGFMRVHTY